MMKIYVFYLLSIYPLELDKESVVRFLHMCPGAAASILKSMSLLPERQLLITLVIRSPSDM